MDSKEIFAIRLTVSGLVQGVGFRPYTARLCDELKIKGYVRNTGGSVEILAAGNIDALGMLKSRLSSIHGDLSDLPNADVTSVAEEKLSISEFESLCPKNIGFYIEKSGKEGDTGIIPPDAGICERCRKELLDPGNRRYRHPFISCVSCGPRFSVMKRLPYDRENTSMEGFGLCQKCAGEYEKSPFRRYAQTIACNDCGPVLTAYVKKNGGICKAGEGIKALELTTECIKRGGIAAVKNTGGYHFVSDALNDEPSLRLRKYKNRENKPFAVMFPDVKTVAGFCRMNETEKDILTSDIRPIVLLDKAEGDCKKLAGEVCRKSSRIGAMLPSDAVQVLLAGECPYLVMTSANRHGEPIISDDDEALELLREDMVDTVLLNDREIVYPLDDSVFQVIETSKRRIVQVIRRARGMVPKPVETDRYFNRALFAAGGDLKNTFAVAKGSQVILSGHYGDLDNAAAFDLWKTGRDHFEDMLSCDPEVFLCDLHPGYVSSGYINEKTGNSIGIQHHYAHIMSVAAENRLHGKILGLALDGTGYGTDKTVWGSELLICNADEPGDFKRAGHFEEIELTGGNDGAKNADITAMCYIYEAQRRGFILPEENPFGAQSDHRIIEKALENRINTYKTTSAGRLFDAVSSITDICHVNSYEGECPVLLEQAAKNSELPEDREDILVAGLRSEDGVFIAETVKLTADIVKLKNRGVFPEEIAGAFHHALCDVLISMFKAVREVSGISSAALSGGTFCNRLLLSQLYDGLEKEGFSVYINEQVPPNDGGLALGQIYACP